MAATRSNQALAAAMVTSSMDSILSPTPLIFLGLDQFVPLELVIRKKGLVVTDRYRLRVPRQVLEGPVLVDSPKV